MTMYTLKRKAEMLENITSFNGTQNQIVIRRTCNSESTHTHSPLQTIQPGCTKHGLSRSPYNKTRHVGKTTTSHTKLRCSNLIIPAQWPPKKSQT